MIHHSALGNIGEAGKKHLASLLRKRKIAWGGNKKLKIYGTLHCASGRRMKMENRVFFSTEREAIAAGYRPCGHCMQPAYREWKKMMARRGRSPSKRHL